MVTHEMVSTAAHVFKISETEAQRHSAEVDGLPLSRFWSPVRGGGGIIIGDDLTYILYGPQVTTQEAIAAYLSGMRTEEE